MDKDEKVRLLKKACNRARLDFDDLISQCKSGEAQFHDGPGACAITAITTSGANKICHVMVLGGDLQGWRDLLPVIEQFARDSGCGTVTGTCRPGTAIPHSEDDQGYKIIATVYEKVL